MITINKGEGRRLLELGGGQNRNPASDVNVDVRPGPGVDFTADFTQPLPIQDNDFDDVFCQYCLEHLRYSDIPAFLKEVFRVMKPGGMAIFVTPNTERQFEFIKLNPTGWDGKDLYNAASELIFGTIDYPENSHKAYLNPEIAKSLFEAAGFTNVDVNEYNERNTDMCITASKPAAFDPNIPIVGIEMNTGKLVQAPNIKASGFLDIEISRNQSIAGIIASGTLLEMIMPERKEMFDRHYFDGGTKVGGYAAEGYRDFPCHEITFQHIMARKPESVLELGAARGYLVKRLQDAGIFSAGFEISKHCLLTRCCEHIHELDICKDTWPEYPLRDQNFDLCFSIATMEHIPEEYLSYVIQNMKRYTKRGLMAIDFGHHDDGFDKTHCTLRPKEWWEAKFKEFDYPCEVVDKEELERGTFPEAVQKGDGKNKVNIGSFSSMFHHGWTNLDIADLRQWAAGQGYNFCHHDVRQGLPFNTGIVDMIYSSHFLEHITYKEGLAFLMECRRVLKPDGALRIAVPDAGLLTKGYELCTLRTYAEVNHDCANAETEAERLWALLGEGHRAFYDTHALERLLTKAGFMAEESDFREATDLLPNLAVRQQMLKEITEGIPCLSLIYEAVPAVG